MSDHVILLDVPWEGMQDFLRDLGWKVETVTGVYGSSTKDRRDDNVMDYAEKNKNSIIVTPDKQLISRLKNKGHSVFGLEMPDLARKVDEILKKEYS